MSDEHTTTPGIALRKRLEPRVEMSNLRHLSEDYMAAVAGDLPAFVRDLADVMGTKEVVQAAIDAHVLERVAPAPQRDLLATVLDAPGDACSPLRPDAADSTYTLVVELPYLLGTCNRRHSLGVAYAAQVMGTGALVVTGDLAEVHYPRERWTSYEIVRDDEVPA